MIPNIPERKHTMNRIEANTRIGIALALMGTPALFAQEPTEPAPITEQQKGAEQEGKEEQKRDVPRLQEIRPDFGGGSDVQDEIRDLFIRVERNLLRMEDYLLDASAGDTSALEKVGPSGMDELLESAQPQSSPEASGVAGVLGRTRTQRPTSARGHRSHHRNRERTRRFLQFVGWRQAFAAGRQPARIDGPRTGPEAALGELLQDSHRRTRRKPGFPGSAQLLPHRPHTGSGHRPPAARGGRRRALG